MDQILPLSTRDLIRGLERYRAIAKHDLLAATDTETPEVHRRHAEVRRYIYAELNHCIETHGTQTALEQALARYEKLPFVHNTRDDEYVDIKAEEAALENFFKMVGLSAKARREARSRRPKLMKERPNTKA